MGNLGAAASGAASLINAGMGWWYGNKQKPVQEQSVEPVVKEPKVVAGAPEEGEEEEEQYYDVQQPDPQGPVESEGLAKYNESKKDIGKAEGGDEMVWGRKNVLKK